MHDVTKSLALEVARKGVTVNTISPGYIGTKMVTRSRRKSRYQDRPQIPVGASASRTKSRASSSISARKKRPS